MTQHLFIIAASVVLLAFVGYGFLRASVWKGRSTNVAGWLPVPGHADPERQADVA